MKYYTIQNNSLLIAENKQALERYYDNVLPLPDDYEEGKYIVIDGELVLNPNWEEEKQKQETQRRNQEIDSKIDDLYKMALPDLLQGNAKNIEIYKEVIESLANNKEELNN